MPPIDPRFMKAKRFPVHAAVILCQAYFFPQPQKLRETVAKGIMKEMGILFY